MPNTSNTHAVEAWTHWLIRKYEKALQEAKKPVTLPVEAEVVIKEGEAIAYDDNGDEIARTDISKSDEAVRAAVEAILKRNAGVVKLKAGLLYFRGYVPFESKIGIVGSTNTMIVPAVDTTVFMGRDISDIMLYNVEIVDSKGVTRVPAIYFDCVSRFILRDIKINNYGLGLSLQSRLNEENTTSHGLISNLHIENARTRGLEIGKDVHDINISNLSVVGAKDNEAGIVIDHTLGGIREIDMCSGITLENVNIKSAGKAGVLIIDWYDLTANNLWIEGCSGDGLVVLASKTQPTNLFFYGVHCIENGGIGINLLGNEKLHIGYILLRGESVRNGKGNLAAEFVDLLDYELHFGLEKAEPPILKNTFAKRMGDVAVVSGDGETVDFKLASIYIPEGIDYKRIIVKCTPESRDAIDASPLEGYLADENNDGRPDAVRVRFSQPPAKGEYNVEVAWMTELHL